MRPKNPDRQIDLPFAFSTKRGDALRMVYSENVESENRGFVVDDLSAFVGDTKVGYMRIENLPSTIFASFYPSALNYGEQIDGCHIFPEGMDRLDLKEADPVTLAYVANRLSYWARAKTYDGLELCSYGEFASWFDSNIRATRWYRKVETDLAQLQAHRLDKPLVGYVNTRDVNPERGQLGNYSGQGVGSALYQAASLELMRRGQALYLSGVVSDEAKVLRGKFVELGWVDVVDGRLSLNGEAIARSLNCDISVEAQYSAPVPGL